MQHRAAHHWAVQAQKIALELQCELNQRVAHLGLRRLTWGHAQMLRTTCFSRYAVKLKRNLPRGQAPVLVLPQSFSTTAKLCEDLVKNCNRAGSEALTAEPWQRVRYMQIVSFHNVLDRLARDAGLCQAERLFEDGWSVKTPLGRTKGRARAGKRGMNLPSDSSLTLLEERLATLCGGYLWPLKVDCFQLLWLALLIEYPIHERAAELLATHHANSSSPEFPNVLATGLTLFEEGSTWKFGVWVGPQHASLPYLAGCLVLLRFCAEKGLSSIAHEIAVVSCQLLAMLGPELQCRGIGSQMLRYCADLILPLGGVHMTPIRIAHASALVNLAALAQWPDNIDVDWDLRKQAMSETLRGTVGKDLLFFCDAVSFSEPRQCRTRLAGSLPASRHVHAEDTDCLEIYRENQIDLQALFLRVPGMETWMRCAQHAEAEGQPSCVSKSSWCDGLLIPRMTGAWGR